MRIVYKLKMCDKVLFNIYILKQKGASFLAQMSMFLRQTLHKSIVSKKG